jgi:hypothetical protein
MAKTGKTAIAITPAQGRRARVLALPEHSTQTGKKGQAALVSAGYVSARTGNIVSISGFYRNAPQTGASDGAKTASLYVVEENLPFKATYLGTLSESVRGLRVNISVDSAGALWLKYDTDSSTVGAARIEDWTSEWEAGDVNPEVVFTVRSGNIFANV